MQVTFHRLPAGRYFSTAVRDDGVTVMIPGYDRTSPTPHDLAHFVAEREFGLTRGFWGSVAAGAMFVNMSVVSGRRRPHAAERSKQIIKDHADGIGASEAVAAVIHEGTLRGLDEGGPPQRERVARAGGAAIQHDAVEKGHSPETAFAALRKMWGVGSPEPPPFTIADIELAVETLRAAVERWAAVPENEGMTLGWTLPVEGTRPVRARRGRPARAGRGGSRSRGSR